MKLKGSCHCKAVKFEVESYTPYPYLRCYCSICRKTAGGGGYAINIMGEAKTLKVTGRKNVKIYHAILGKTKQNKIKRSPGRRHFCKNCASCLWIDDPRWPEWVYPFASAIDRALPNAPETLYSMLAFKAPWCQIPKKSKHAKIFKDFSEESIEDWHKRHKLYLKP